MDGPERGFINNMHDWLTSQVRHLSRVLVSKCKGQVAVWNNCNEPGWWEKEVGLSWKNPTSNPKDTKETLIKKYTALKKYLKMNGTFPEDVEDEAKLWENREDDKLLLLSSLKSLRCNAINLGKKVKEITEKAERGKMLNEENQVMLKEIQDSLRSTANVIDEVNRINPGSTNIRQSGEPAYFQKSIESDEVKCQGMEKLKSNLEVMEVACAEMSVLDESRNNGQIHLGKYQKNKKEAKTGNLRAQNASSSVERKRKCPRLDEDDDLTAKKSQLESRFEILDRRSTFSPPVTTSTGNVAIAQGKPTSTPLTILSRRLDKPPIGQSPFHSILQTIESPTSSCQLPITAHKPSNEITVGTCNQLNSCSIATSDPSDIAEVTNIAPGLSIPNSSHTTPQNPFCSNVAETSQTLSISGKSVTSSACKINGEFESIINNNYNLEECLQLFNSPLSFVSEEFINSCN